VIRSIREKNHFIEIDLTGKQGNVFVLLSYAKKLGYLLGLSEEEIKDILKEMQSGDYEHLIKVFDDNFGEFVILYW